MKKLDTQKRGKKIYSMTYFLNAVFTRRRAGEEEGAIVGASSYEPIREEIYVRKMQ
jgi:hypothetical protein